MAISKKRIVKIVTFIFPILLGIFLIFYSFSNLTEQDINAIKKSFKTADYAWVILSIFLGVLSHLSRAYRWNFLLEPLGYRVKLANSVFLVFIAYLLNIFIPRSGEIARATMVKKHENIPFEKALGTIFAERVFDVIILMLIIAIAFYLQTDLIEEYLWKDKGEGSIIKWVILIVGALLALWAYRHFKNSENPIVLKVIRFIQGLIEGVKSVLTMCKKGAFLFHTFFIWAMYLLMFYVVTFAIPETSGISISAVIVAFVVGGLSMALTNGGLGTYPVFVAGVLLLYDVPNHAALAFGWIMWTSQTVMVLLFGSLSMILLPFYNKKTA